MADAAEEQYIDDDAAGDESDERYKALDALGKQIAKQRGDWIDARRTSGIEQEWLEDEEFYEGIDDANRGDMAAWRSKPLGTAAPDPDADKEVGSNVFLNITRPYVDSGAARVGDMLLPATGGKGWQIKTTPIPEFAKIAEGDIPPHIVKAIEQDEQLAGDTEAIEKTKLDLIEETAEEQEAYQEAAKKAEKRMEDWQVECQYNAHVRQVIEDTAKCGAGVLKGPFPEYKKQVAWINGELEINEEIVPGSRRTDFWNLFPDPECGQSIHDGSGIFERDDITRKSLTKLKKDSNYIETQIDLVLKEGPHEAYTTDESNKLISDRNSVVGGLHERKNKHLFEIWYYHGLISKEDLEKAGCECPEDAPETVSASLTMVNNKVIHARLNHLDTGEYPYDIFVWQRRANSPWGTGIARQMRTPQRIVNGAARNMMDNAGIAGGPQWVFLRGLVEPMDDVYELTPWKGWAVSEDSGIMDIKDAFNFIFPPMMQQEMQAIINMGIDMAERVTGLPMLLQGMQDDNAATLGETRIRNNNGSTVLRRIARLFDDLLTEPHQRRYYTYLMQYGPEDDEKGDFSIEAIGSSTLLQRDLADEGMAQIGTLVTNPVYGKDPRKWMDEYLRTQQINPTLLDYEDDEWQSIVENLASGPEDPRQAIAQFNAEVQGKLKQMEQAFKERENAKDRHEKDKDRQISIAFKRLDVELGKLDLIGTDKQNTDRIKGSVGEAMLRLRAQLQIAGMKDVTPGPQVATPIAEPPGRAEDGKAFQQ